MLPKERRINSKKDLKDWIKYEKERNNYKIHPILDSFNFREEAIIGKFLILLRKTEYYLNTKKKFGYAFNLFKLNRLKYKYGFSISLNVCGRGLKIMHVGSILINGKSIVGEDCSIHIGTKIVAGGRDDNAPEIGKNCVIGVGAAIVGGVKIGNGVAIGANAVVNKSFEEDNIAIAGVPAKKISNNGTSTWNKKDKE